MMLQVAAITLYHFLLILWLVAWALQRNHMEGKTSFDEHDMLYSLPLVKLAEAVRRYNEALDEFHNNDRIKEMEEK